MEILFKTTMPICVYHWPFKKKIQGLLSYIIFIYSFFSGGGVGWTSASKLKLYRRCYLLKKKKKNCMEGVNSYEQLLFGFYILSKMT